MAAGILLSRLVGLVRQKLFAHYLGNGLEAAAFSAATRIPNVLQNLLGEGVPARTPRSRLRRFDRGERRGGIAAQDREVGALVDRPVTQVRRPIEDALVRIAQARRCFVEPPATGEQLGEVDAGERSQRVAGDVLAALDDRLVDPAEGGEQAADRAVGQPEFGAGFGLTPASDSFALKLMLISDLTGEHSLFRGLSK